MLRLDEVTAEDLKPTLYSKSQSENDAVQLTSLNPFDLLPSKAKVFAKPESPFSVFDDITKKVAQSKNSDWNMLDFDEIPNVPHSDFEVNSAFRSINQYCWENKFNTSDIQSIQRVLNCNDGVNLDMDGDIGKQTAYQISKFAYDNKLTLSQACDELKKAGEVYDSLYSDMQLSQQDLINIQTNANILGYKNINGNELGVDGLIGYNTLFAINDYATSNNIGLKTAAIDLRDGNNHDREKQNLESLILDKGKDFEKDEKSFFNYDKVSKHFSEIDDVNFDHENITKVYVLNNENGAKTFGHNALMLMDDKGRGAFFSYYPEDEGDLNNLVGKSNGEMRFKALHTNEVEAFLKNMSLSSLVSTDGETEKEEYTRFIPFDITAEQGSKMLDCAIDFFVKPGMYGLFENNIDDVNDNTWQCDSVTRYILETGGIKTNGRIWPNWSFFGTKIRN